VPSRQDQLHSYQYTQQRVVSALVTHDPDPHRSPLRRAGTTALVSVLVAAIAVTAAAIYGILTGAGNNVPESDAKVYLEKGTGAAYVLLKPENRLHPVLNYTSGLLIANATAPDTENISSKALAQLPLGDPLGIPGAPASLPDPPNLLTEDWSVCTAKPDASSKPTSTLLVGAPAGGSAISDTDGLLVKDPADQMFLIFGGRRFLIPDNRTLSILQWSTKPIDQVAAAWINAIPRGPDLVAPHVDNFGARSGVRQASHIGQLITDGQQWAVALADGKAFITSMQAQLMRTGGTDPVNVGVDFSDVPMSKTSIIDNRQDGLPQVVPTLVDPPATACMTLSGTSDGKGGLRLGPTIPAGTPVAATRSPGVMADAVYIQRGYGALVVSAASPTAPDTTGTVSLITDTGKAYPLAGRDLLGKLGYGNVKPRQIPAQFLALMPQGPALDPVQARKSAAEAGG
jgi:type VII secretion protein EccB